MPDDQSAIAPRRILDDTHDRLAAGAERDVDVGPAGEWLLDDFHVVREHIREVRETLPRGYHRELPELAGGHLAGYPRVYEPAITLISHTESRVDLDNLERFVAAFQEVEPLSIGELWAVRAMLRLAHTQVMMAHGITSPRTIAHLDWQAFVERQSAMEAVLRGDPAGFYPRMTFATRDRYRHVVERITRRTGRREEDGALVAAAVEGALQAASRARPALAARPGGGPAGGALDGIAGDRPRPQPPGLTGLRRMPAAERDQRCAPRPPPSACSSWPSGARTTWVSSPPRRWTGGWSSPSAQETARLGARTTRAPSRACGNRRRSSVDGAQPVPRPAGGTPGPAVQAVPQ